MSHTFHSWCNKKNCCCRIPDFSIQKRLLQWQTDRLTDWQTIYNTHIRKVRHLENTHKNADVADLTVILRCYVQTANNILLTSVTTLRLIDDKRWHRHTIINTWNSDVFETYYLKTVSRHTCNRVWRCSHSIYGICYIFQASKEIWY